MCDRQVGDGVRVEVTDGDPSGLHTGGEFGRRPEAPEPVPEQDRDVAGAGVGDRQVRGGVPVEVTDRERHGGLAGSEGARRPEAPEPVSELDRDGVCAAVGDC